MIPQPSLEELYQRGWSLIPTGPNKTPLATTWKHYQSECPTWNQIEEWQSISPAGWAAVTGNVSNFFSLDFDGADGRATLNSLGLDPHRRSPSGGYHVDFDYPLDWEVRTVSSKTDLALGAAYPGMDIRGKGGYVIVLGENATGHYVWERSDRPYLLDLLPGSLTSILHKRQPEVKLPREMDSPFPESIEECADGNDHDISLLRQAIVRLEQRRGRNDTGFWLCCQLRDHGRPKESARELMRRYVAVCPPTNTKGVTEPYTHEDAEKTLDQVYKAEAREPFLPERTDRRSIVVTNRQLRDLVRDARKAVEATNVPPTLFSHQGDVVSLREVDDRKVMERMTPDSMRVMLADVADWLRMSEKGPRSVSPPQEVVRSVLATEWGALPSLRGIVEAPILRGDGTVVTEPGYDAMSKLWLHLPKGLRLPDIRHAPGDETVRRAARFLDDELLGEFPFDDQSSRANALALLLTPVLRSAIDGCIPLAVIDATCKGTGKTYLAKVVSLLATGREPSLKPPPSRDEEEVRKVITSTLVGGEPVVVFDNVDTVLKSSSLATMLTTGTWSDRLLTVSKNVSADQQTVWMVTGNNVVIGGDLPRRAFRIGMDAQSHRPWERNFRRPDLDKWVMANRAELLAACLTLYRAWKVRGTQPKTRPWGSFTEWQRTLSGILHVAGIEGFLGNLTEFQEHADPDDVLWEGVLRRWHDTYGSEPKCVRDLDIALGGCDLPAELSESLRGTTADNRNSRLGKKLKKLAGRRFAADGLRIESAGYTSHAKTNRWKVVLDVDESPLAC